MFARPPALIRASERAVDGAADATTALAEAEERAKDVARSAHRGLGRPVRAEGRDSPDIQAMVALTVVLLGRLLDPISIVAAVSVAWVAGGKSVKLVVPPAALAMSAVVNVVYCSLQTSCREPFDGQGIVLWLIGAVASAVHLVVAILAVRWLRSRSRSEQ